MSFSAQCRAHPILEQSLAGFETGTACLSEFAGLKKTADIIEFHLSRGLTPDLG
jgi:hypothetical protein